MTQTQRHYSTPIVRQVGHIYYHHYYSHDSGGGLARPATPRGENIAETTSIQT